ncbi:serine phosphatase [Halobacillus karajensis]|uniref:Stage II sporulation protein E n=1 Tax=Halobacillus karajensis TaxID=195088 RepID=A0A024P997_9BACI|nr:SpoIIE family protein phosphatase [Halobacillus karajensis]CDQ21493.1 stage II sporulation protein E [Halobacillus karajensis]CDQ25428.1 stage II sporulation protein E [Halobacillus karajensis]CDQ29041.1 stage II sporulation protein E [Halobacillus karajensis]SEI09508.1 serine phosphatase [Halobacillus karajensis]
MNLSVFQKAKKGNYYCGDSYFYKETDNAFLCALADGLGSGEMARESSKAVMEVIEENPELTVEPLVKKCNEVLVGKRGVVLGILRIDFNALTYSYSSIGNIGVITVDPDGVRNRNIPLAGYLSGYPRSLRITHGKVQKGMVFLMFSDGVNDRRLSSKFTRSKGVEQITEHYKDLYGQSRDDDTTLIAIEYE